MRISTEEWQRGAFRIWMRTGRWPNIAAAKLLEAKYNHWHDPANGQFTLAGTGVHDGTPSRGIRPGGGSFGGGGASGDRPLPGQGPGSPTATPVRPKTQHATAKPAGAGVLSGTAPARPASVGDAGKPPATGDRAQQSARPTEQFRSIIRNGYRYLLDRLNRTRQVSGEVSSGGTQPRSRRLQARAGVPDRRPTDDGGHFIAPRFNGPAEAFNHFAQDANFNRGRYRAIEDEWAQAKRRGFKVTIRIVAIYEGASTRPAYLDIYYVYGGNEHSQKIWNTRQERSRGK